MKPTIHTWVLVCAVAARLAACSELQIARSRDQTVMELCMTTRPPLSKLAVRNPHPSWHAPGGNRPHRIHTTGRQEPLGRGKATIPRRRTTGKWATDGVQYHRACAGVDDHSKSTPGGLLTAVLPVTSATAVSAIASVACGLSPRLCDAGQPHASWYIVNGTTYDTLSRNSNMPSQTDTLCHPI